MATHHLHAADAHARCAHGHDHGHGHATGEATDPVCGMRVDRASAKHRAMHEGTEFVFCSAGCQNKFEADPEAYVG